jgi:hypothetical protein
MLKRIPRPDLAHSYFHELSQSLIQALHLLGHQIFGKNGVLSNVDAVTSKPMELSPSIAEFERSLSLDFEGLVECENTCSLEVFQAR